MIRAGTPADPLILPGGVLAAWTGRDEGDLGPAAGAGADERRRRVLDRRWSWVRQVHGNAVAVLGPKADEASPEAGRATGADGPDAEPVQADALVGPASWRESALAIFTADCAPVALASPEGVMASVHAGWRGLVAGAISAAATTMRELGATNVVGALGPCIHASCYEFGELDLVSVEEVLGLSVRAATSEGTAALDLPAAVRAAAVRAEVEIVFDAETCTACSDGWFSHRARGERERQALIVWHP